MDDTSVKSQYLRKVRLTFSVIFFLFMGVRAIFAPFIPLYLEERGLSADLIGLVSGINSFAIIISQPAWGILADRIHSTRKTLVICLIGQAVFAAGLLLADHFFLIAVGFCIYTFFSSTEGPLLDVWALTSVKEAGDPNGLGYLKTWGCIGYAIASVLAGLSVKGHAPSGLLPYFAVLLLGLAGFMYAVKIGSHAQGAGRASSLKDLRLGRILKDRRFLVFLIYAFFMQLGHRSTYTFQSVYMHSLGGEISWAGYSSAIMFVSETIVMAFGRRMLRRFRPITLIMASSVAFAVWQFFLFLAKTPSAVVLACLMDGPAYGLFTFGTLYYIEEISKKEISTTYQTVGHSVYYGLSGLIGNLLGGAVIRFHGYKTMYAAAVAVTLLSTLCFCLYNRFRKQNAC